MNVQRSLHPQYHNWGAVGQGTEPPTAPRVPQHNWLPTAPGVCSRCVCVFTAVCVHFGWVKCRAQILSTWSYHPALSVIYLFWQSDKRLFFFLHYSHLHSFVLFNWFALYLPCALCHFTLSISFYCFIFLQCPHLYICVVCMYIWLNCIYLYLNVYCQCLILTVCTRGLRVTQFQFSVCMYCTCGRIDNKARLDLTWLDLYVTSLQKHSFSLHKFLTDGLEWCVLLWCFYQLFGLSFWRHPFTCFKSWYIISWKCQHSLFIFRPYCHSDYIKKRRKLPLNLMQ